MNTYDVKIYITVSGFGAINTPGKPITRTVSALSIQEAIEEAKKDIMMLEVVAVHKIEPPVV